MRKRTSGGFLIAAVLLGGCEHTALLPPTRSGPDPQMVRSVTGLQPAEFATLLRMSDRVEPFRLDGEPWSPWMGHPLDGLSPDQIRQLFAAAGLPPERYAARWLRPRDTRTEVPGAR